MPTLLACRCNRLFTFSTDYGVKISGSSEGLISNERTILLNARQSVGIVSFTYNVQRISNLTTNDEYQNYPWEGLSLHEGVQFSLAA